MRQTQDGFTLHPTDHAYEILYRYNNPEISTPEPDRRPVKDIPLEIKIWKEESNCWKAINKMQKQDS